jgi:hypothetical protein
MRLPSALCRIGLLKWLLQAHPHLGEGTVVSWDLLFPKSRFRSRHPPSPRRGRDIFVPIMAIPSSKMSGEREYLRLLRAGHAGGQVSIQVKGEKIKDTAPDTRWRSAAWRLVLDCGYPVVRGAMAGCGKCQ